MSTYSRVEERRWEVTRNGGNVLWVVYVCVGVRVRVLCAVVLCCCCCSPAATHTSTNKIASFFLSFFLQVPSAGPRYELLHYPSEAYAGTIRRGRRNRPQGRRFMAGRRSGENLIKPPTVVFRHRVYCVVLCILWFCVHVITLTCHQYQLLLMFTTLLRVLFVFSFVYILYILFV